MDYYNSASIAMCSHCQSRLPRSNVCICEKCCCIFYCSSHCRNEDENNAPNALHCHKNWCSKMQSYMQLENALIQSPFTFTKETTSRKFDSTSLSQFLMKNGVFGKGMWRRECLLWIPPGDDFFEAAVPLPGEFQEDSSSFAWVLPSESVALSSSPSNAVPERGLTSWEDYYNWRGFSFDSPIAVLQQWPLTIYHVFTRLFIEQHPKKYNEIMKKRLLKIHIIGAEKEVELLSAFQELKYLIPNIKLELFLIGKDVSPKVDKTTTVKDNLRFSIRRGVYHTVGELDVPDFVIGFNAGLSVFLSWPDTIRHLKNRKIPSYFTDYCPYSCENGRLMLQAQKLGEMSSVEINPFRSPLRILSDQNNLPWFSNAFLFYIRFYES